MLAVDPNVDKHHVFFESSMVDDKKITASRKQPGTDLIMSPCHIRQIRICEMIFCFLIYPVGVSRAAINKR
jgi:hypothetical protein